MKKDGFFIIAILFLIFLIIAIIPIINFSNKSDLEGRIYCVDEQRNVEACVEVYSPVCGYVQIECITTPCNPIEENFSNSCFACQNERVLYYIEGECA